MEAVYRRGVAGKRHVQKSAAAEQGSRRRLAQLLVSLTLFLLVFIGRGVFPIQMEKWGELLASDIDVKAVFQRFQADLAGDGNIGTAFGQLIFSAFGGTAEPDPAPAAAPEQTVRPVTMLNETELHGLAWLQANSFLRNFAAEPESLEPEPSASPEHKPEVVTAVAQVYNSAGEKLPSNVSYEYYELGLDETVSPVMGTVSSGFEYRISPISGKREFHLALDIAAPEGTKIGAYASGVVRYIGKSDEFGLYLMIDHDNNVSTFYAHCSKLLVRKGDTVACGETVALVGQTGKATGPHLHFTLLKDDVRLDPAYYVDPS